MERDNGELLQTYVQWKSLHFHRISDRHYIECNGDVYSLTKWQVTRLLNKLKKLGIEQPLTAAGYIISNLSRYKRA